MSKIVRLRWPSFKVDVLSLIDWLKSTYASNFMGMNCDIAACQIFVLDTFSSDDEAELRAHFSGLDESTEATKLALPSRLSISAKAARDQLIKAVISSKTWDAMSVAERKFAMGAVLTSAEYDSLSTS